LEALTDKPGTDGRSALHGTFANFHFVERLGRIPSVPEFPRPRSYEDFAAETVELWKS
jgi:hypothetical protein